MIVEVVAAFFCFALGVGFRFFKKWWEDDFSWRVPRSSDKSPSNGLLPALRELPFARRRSSRNVIVVPLVEEEEETARGGATKNDAPDEHRKEEEATIRRRSRSFRRKRSKVLNMDHILLSFMSFCAVHVLVYPWVIADAAYRLALLSLREFLFRGGWVQPKKHDPAEVAAKIILEQPMIIFFRGWRSDEHGRDIATFCWDNISYFSNRGDEKEGNHVRAKLMVEVDLKRKRVVTGNLDGEVLIPAQLITLLHWAAIQSHVAVHAMANWAVNLEANNSEVRWYSAVTVAYNYFGCVGFRRGESLYRFFGLLSPGNTLKAFDKFILDGAQGSVPAHADVVELMPHSELVTFVEKLRTPFLKAFSRYKDTDFAGCEAEALFVGTIIHSLDHSQMLETVTDPLWHDVDDPKFGYTAEILRIAFIAFHDDHPCLLFNKSFKNAKHPFYQEVYKAARKINPKFADKLDTCIVK